MSSIVENIAVVRSRIKHAVKAAGRSDASVLLLAVSKTKPAQAVREAYSTGIRDFGENYLQESLEKIASLKDLTITWHFIGSIQSNKTRPLAEHFDWVHAVDRLKVASRLSEQRPAHLPPLNICIEVNVSNEASKAGVPLNELPELAAHIAQLPNLTLRGLMAIPEATTDKKAQITDFNKLASAYTDLKKTISTLDTLSMGMSSDLESAILCGSTIVRIGTDIFGARNTTKES